MRTLFLLLVVVSVLTCGCSNKPYQPKQYPQSVSGIATSKNKPVSDADIYFSDTTRKIFIAAKTDTQGRFTVLAQDLPVGRYAVYLGPDKPEIPKQYQSPLESPLVVNIQAGTNELTLDLK